MTNTSYDENESKYHNFFLVFSPLKGFMYRYQGILKNLSYIVMKNTKNKKKAQPQMFILFSWLLLLNYFFALRRQEISGYVPFVVGLTPCVHLYSLYTSRISKNSLLMIYPWSVFLIKSCFRQNSMTSSCSLLSYIISLSPLYDKSSRYLLSCYLLPMNIYKTTSSK